LTNSMSAKYNAQRLIGKVAIVTAATNGIGLAIAERLGHEGAKLAISSRKAGNVDKAVKYLVDSGLDTKNVCACVCHVGNAEDRQKLVQLAVERFGRIDILVNNAGINPSSGDILETSEEVWDKLFDVNLKAGFLLTKLVVPHMTSGGNVIFNASITAYTCSPIIAAYGVTKTAILGLTKALAGSLASKNIRVNCISPGIIKTNFSKALWEGTEQLEQINNEMEQAGLHPPLGRYGTPNECAGTVAFLCSDDASYITGESIVIGGGAQARL